MFSIKLAVIRYMVSMNRDEPAPVVELDPTYIDTVRDIYIEA